METISHREENIPSSRPVGGIVFPGFPKMSPIGSLRKCRLRTREIEMKRHLSDIISIRSDFQGEGTVLHSKSHACENVSPVCVCVWGGVSSRTRNSSVRITPLGIFLGLEGL